MIKGIPNGWEVVEFRCACENEYFINNQGQIEKWTLSRESTVVLPIICKKPKQYRPFANAAEFEPFRDRWWKKTCGDDRVYPPCYYNDSYSGGLHFDRCFIDRIFDDGTPFGIEVTECK